VVCGDRRASFSSFSVCLRRPRPVEDGTCDGRDDDLLECRDVPLRRTAEPVEEREGPERADHLACVEIADRRDPNGHVTEKFDGRTARTDGNPPARSEGSCATPTSISTPPASISWTTKPSTSRPWSRRRWAMSSAACATSDGLESRSGRRHGARRRGARTVPPRISSTLRVEVAAHRQGHQRLPRVHAVLGLVEHHGVGAVDDLVGDLLAAVGRQAVHV